MSQGQEIIEPGNAGGNKFIRNSVILLIIELSTKFLGLILFIIIARFLGANDLGVYSFGLAISNLFSIAPTFGFDKRVQKEIGRDASLIYSHYKEISILKILFALLSLAALWLTLMLMGEQDILPVILIACFLFTMSFNNFINGLFRGFGRPELEMMVRMTFSLLNLGLGAAALLSGLGLYGLLSSQIVSAGISFLVAITVLNRISVKVTIDLSLKNLWNHIVKSSPYAGNVLILYMSNQINYVILNSMADKVAVGYFSTAGRIFETITLIPAAIMGAFLPLMSRFYSEKHHKFDQTLYFTMKYLFVISLGLLAGTWLVGDELVVSLFGSEFLPSGLALKLLNSSLIFSFWNFVFTNILIATDQEKKLVPLFSAGASIHILGNILLINYFSYNGAAASVIVTQGIQLLIVAYFAKDHFSLRQLISLTPGPLISVIPMIGAVWFLKSINLWLAIGCGCLLYLISLILLKTISRSELMDMRGYKTEIGGK